MKPALTGLVFLFFIPTLLAQPEGSISIPRKVMDSFILQYPDARNVKWLVKEDLYRADFINYKKSTIAILKENGSHFRTETEINVCALPTEASEWLLKKEQVKSITDAVIVQDETGTITFKASVRKNEYWFDASGQLLDRHVAEVHSPSTLSGID